MTIETENKKNTSHSIVKLPMTIRGMSLLYGLFTNRFISSFLSFIVLIFSYLLDCYLKERVFLSGSGALISCLGLILTIKHHYLLNISSMRHLLDSNTPHGGFVSPDWDSPENKKKATEKAMDEGIGVSIVLLGGIVSFLSPLVPLISLCS